MIIVKVSFKQRVLWIYDLMTIDIICSSLASGARLLITEGNVNYL